MCSSNELVRLVSVALSDLDEPDTGLGAGLADDYLALRGLVDRLEEVGLRWLAAVDAAGVAAGDGSASTAAWVRRHTGCSAQTATADVRLGRRLHTDPERPLATTATLLREGSLTVGHARVLARATATMGREAFTTAEPLVAKSAAGLSVDAAAHVAVQVCRHAEARHADGQDDPGAARRAAADADRRLHLSPCGDLYALDALLTAEAGEALRAVLAPLSMPDRDRRASPTRGRPRSAAPTRSARLLSGC